MNQKSIKVSDIVSHKKSGKLYRVFKILSTKDVILVSLETKKIIMACMKEIELWKK